MSSNFSRLRAALTGLIDAVADIPTALPEPLAVALDKAIAAHQATRFIAPQCFPANYTTRSGAIVTLLAHFEGELVGSWVDRDGRQIGFWNTDGTLFGPTDADDFDLCLPVDAFYAPAGTKVIPFMGRVA
jgi:hypothetical protein